VTRCPLLSVTVTLSGTRRVSEEKTASPSSGAEDLVCCADKTTGASSAAAIAGKRKNFRSLLRRRIIAGSPECVQGRQSPRLYQFDIDLSILAVANLVSRAIAENILITKLDSDLGRHIWQLIQIFHHKMPAPGALGKIRQQPRPGEFLGRTPAVLDHLVNPDRIDLDVRFLHQVLDFRFRVPAAVITTV